MEVVPVDTRAMQETVHISTRLGLTLTGSIVWPSGHGHKYPFVILLHGFTGWKDERHIRTLADDLAAAGVATLRCDAPGSGESEGTFAQDYTLTNYITAVQDIIAWAQAERRIDGEKIAIWGHSMGGFVALASAVRYSTLKAVCCCEPSSGWKVMEPQAEKEWQETGWATFSNRHFSGIRLPYSFLTDRSHYNALKESPELKMPSLFIAGTYDTDVLPDSVRSIADLAPEPTQYLEFPATHGYKNDIKMLSAINDATVSFFKQYLL